MTPKEIAKKVVRDEFGGEMQLKDLIDSMDMSFEDNIKQELFNDYLLREFRIKKAQVESSPKKE